MTGTVKTLKKNSGFGFIRGDEDNIEYFFHMTACSSRNVFNEMVEGKTRVRFEVKDNSKGPRAESVVVI